MKLESTTHVRASLFFALLLAVSFATVSAQQPASKYLNRWWTGWFQAFDMPLQLTFSLVGPDSIAPVLYSPLQSSEPIFASSWTLEDDSLQMKCKSIGLTMSAKYSQSANQWSCAVRQGLASASAQFDASDTLLQLSRPQTPKEPYSFLSEEITTTYRDHDGNEIKLSGTLTYPQGAGVKDKFPTVMLVSGSGQQNRDEELLQHKPFLVIADYLARQGIATLRYDDRGVGMSHGPLANATTLDFADDAEAMFKQLLKNPHVDRNLVGIAGHSEGGMIAPMVASRNKKVKFIILLAAPAVTGLEILETQNYDLFMVNGVSPRLAQKRKEYIHAICQLSIGKTYNVDRNQLFAIVDSLSRGLTEEECAAIDMTRKSVRGTYMQLSQPWMRTFLQIDPANYMKKVKCPILALAGSKDMQVSARTNIATMQWLTQGRATTHIEPNLNHLFQHCESGSANEYWKIEETFDVNMLKLMSEWINKQRH